MQNHVELTQTPHIVSMPPFLTVMSLMMTLMLTLMTVMSVRGEDVTKQTLFGCNQDSVHLHCPPGAGVNIIR